MHTSARQRLGGQIPTNGRLDSHTTTVEYVNRLGERVSPSTGRPYFKPVDSSTNGLIKNKNKSGKQRRRRPPVKLAGSMFGNLDPIPTDVTRDPPPRACFNCWQQGHSRRECPRPLQAIYCNNCGRRGEDLRSCPRCSRAHNEYLLRLQARERGEEVEPEEVMDETLLGGERAENDDACDEVLRELIYQDDRAREMRRSSYSQNSQEAYISSKLILDLPDRRQNEQSSSYRDREEDEYVQRGYDYNNYYGRRSDSEERDVRSNSRQQDREYEDGYSHRNKDDRSDEYYKESRERADSASYRGGERERDYEARASRSENRSDGLERRNVSNAFDDVDLDADPVQEVLQLAKSIAHLTPETQDLIMRQVMAERKERVRIRAMKLQERHSDLWR